MATAQAYVVRDGATGNVTRLRALNGGGYEEVASQVAVTRALEADSIAYATLTLQFTGGRIALERQNGQPFALGVHDLQTLLSH